MSLDYNSPEYIAARNKAIAEKATHPDGFNGHDETDPKGPSGHAYGLRASTRLTSDFRRTHRKEAMDITPQQVVGVLVAADVKQWVLIGLHGYVGYLPTPRATQNVDIMAPTTSNLILATRSEAFSPLRN